MSFRAPPPARLLPGALAPLLLAGLTSCSVLFDAGGLTDGNAGSAGSQSAAGTTTGAGGGTSGAAGTGGAGGSPPGSSGQGGEGGGVVSASGAGGVTSAGSGGGGGIGGAGGACSGPTFCEGEGDGAAHCFDFDGASPLGGLDVYAPNDGTVSTELVVVDDPSFSCPQAVVANVLAASGADRAFALLGTNVPAGQDRFLWSFATHRVSAESATATQTIAIVSWGFDATLCQAILSMTDDAGTSSILLYVQGNDGVSGWVGIGSAAVPLDHPTIGAWTQIELQVDLIEGVMRVGADGRDAETTIDSLCGPTTDLYDVDVGAHFTALEQSTVYDDFLIRYLP